MYPAAGFLAIAIKAEHQQARARKVAINGYKLREVSISRVLLIPQNLDSIDMMISLRPYSESSPTRSDLWNKSCISSSTNDSLWTENCRELISVQKHSQDNELDGAIPPYSTQREVGEMYAELETTCTEYVAATETYKPLDKIGLRFGHLFANIRPARIFSDKKCIADVVIPDTAAVMPANFEYPFVVYPATLDSCLYTVFPIDN